jgi:hypothetical protein
VLEIGHTVPRNNTRRASLRMQCALHWYTTAPSLQTTCPRHTYEGGRNEAVPLLTKVGFAQFSKLPLFKTRFTLRKI